MKTNFLFLVLSSLLAYSAAFGQEANPETVKRITVSDISVQLGTFSGYNNYGNISDFRKLAPQSEILNNDFADYLQFNNFRLLNNRMFSMMMGIKFSDKQKKSYKSNYQLRLGFSYSFGNNFMKELYAVERQAYDTLISQKTGQAYYIDSTTSHHYTMNYSSEELRFDASLIFKTKPEYRFTFHTGIGVSAGVSFNAQTYISYTKSASTDLSSNYNHFSYSSYYSGTYSEKHEFIQNSDVFGVSTYIPLGVNFQIGKNREFWKQFHVFYELRPGINIVSVPELRTIVNANFQQGIGLKVAWN